MKNAQCHDPSLTLVHEGECKKGNLTCIPRYAKFEFFTINQYSKKFCNILGCTHDSDCTGRSDSCVEGQCRCGKTNPAVCAISTNPAVKIMCINGDCVRKPGNKSNAEFCDKYIWLDTIDCSQIISAIYIYSRTWEMRRERSFMRPSWHTLLWRFELWVLSAWERILLHRKGYDFLKVNESDYTLYFSQLNK